MDRNESELRCKYEKMVFLYNTYIKNIKEELMKIAICDDQLAHIDMLKPYINEFFRIKEMDIEIFEFFSGESILRCQDTFDIIFLDIELGDTTGLDVAKQLKCRNSNSVIIVVTSYTEYLDDVMDLHVIRFLKKPVVQNRVYSALEKALQEINENFLTFSTRDNQIIRVKSRDIIYVEAKLKYVTVYTMSNTYCIKEPLKKVKGLLSSSDFAIPHNSFIVNMNHISKFRREEIILDMRGIEVHIQVSNRKQPEFKRRFMVFIGEGE